MFSTLVLMALGGAALSGEVEHLEYRFHTGQELVYAFVSKENLLENDEQSRRRYETRTRWNIYPVRQNANGSWHLVIKTSVRMLRYDREATENGQLGKWNREPFVRFENSFLGYCDLMPDGSYEQNSTLGGNYNFELIPEIILRPLPRARLQDEDPITKVAPASGTSYTWTQSVLDGNMATLTGTLERPKSANMESTHRQMVEFDTNAGRVQKIVVTDTSTHPKYPSHHRTTYALIDVVEHSPSWIADFSVAADRYFAARDQWQDQIDLASSSRTEAACRSMAETARQRLEVSRKTVESPEVLSAFDALLDVHDAYTDSLVENAAKREELFSAPPVEWTSTNLQGEARSHTDYLGNVVILDFWYRGCTNCVLALPKLKTLHRKYKGRPVVLLGVNNDSDVADARFVVDAYSIPYDSVRNVLTPDTDGESGDSENERRISSEYKVNGWPTFVVLDQTGRIADVVNGNADDLVERISRTVDSLLSSQRLRGE